MSTNGEKEMCNFHHQDHLISVYEKNHVPAQHEMEFDLDLQLNYHSPQWSQVCRIKDAFKRRVIFSVRSDYFLGNF